MPDLPMPSPLPMFLAMLLSAVCLEDLRESHTGYLPWPVQDLTPKAKQIAPRATQGPLSLTNFETQMCVVVVVRALKQPFKQPFCLIILNNQNATQKSETLALGRPTYSPCRQYHFLATSDNLCISGPGPMQGYMVLIRRICVYIYICIHIGSNCIMALDMTLHGLCPQASGGLGFSYGCEQVQGGDAPALSAG